MQETANNKPTIETDFALPILKGLAAGCFLGLTAFVLAVVFEWSIGPWALGAIAFCVGGFLGWLAFDNQAAARHNPPPAPRPEPTPRTFDTTTIAPTFKLNISWDGGHQGDLQAVLGITWEQFVLWCTGVSDGVSLGENHWCGSKGCFSKPEYINFRNRAIHYGLVKQRARHYSSGYILSEKGRAVTSEVVRQYAHQVDHPTPTVRSYTPTA